jgi:hypothetical protein
VRATGSAAARSPASGSPARAGDPEGRTVLTRPVCTPGPDPVPDQRFDAGRFPQAGGPARTQPPGAGGVGVGVGVGAGMQRMIGSAA